MAAWSVDRLGRSLPDLLGFLGDLQAKNVDLYVHEQALGTSTPSGKAMFGMLGAFAEFERSIMQERVKAGLARAKAKGRTSGRPKADLEIEDRIRELASQEIGKVKNARTPGVGSASRNGCLGRSAVSIERRSLCVTARHIWVGAGREPLSLALEINCIAWAQHLLACLLRANSHVETDLATVETLSCSA